MISFEAAATTHVGRVRHANEDGYFDGDSVFAVADGMGGHLAGEVASATALEPVATLDGRVFPDASAAVAALRQAVTEANEAVARKAADEPTYRGMGTTLTAAMVEGRRLHVAHVGDSRAYLLRDGVFSQLTNDHTLVQHLVDEGQLSAEEAESHPQRSVVTRAIGVSHHVDVDTLSLELQPGDQVLLCSDGLTGVVPDEHIAAELAADRPSQQTARRLVELANERGGPDNITVVLLRVLERREGGDGDRGDRPHTVVVSRPADDSSRDWVDRLSQLGNLGKQRRTPPLHTGRRRLRRLTAGLLALVVVGGVVAGGGWWLLSRSFYVGLAGEQVAVYRGVPGRFGPVELSWVDERTGLHADEVPAFYRRQLEQGIPAADRAEAELIVRNAPRRSSGRDATVDADPAASPTPAAP